jgi:hypothetical protein
MQISGCFPQGLLRKYFNKTRYKVQKPNNSECYAQSPEPFRIYSRQDRGSRKPRLMAVGDPLRWPRETLCPQKFALTSPTSGGRSVGIVRLRTKSTEIFFYETGSCAIFLQWSRYKWLEWAKAGRLYETIKKMLTPIGVLCYKSLHAEWTFKVTKRLSLLEKMKVLGWTELYAWHSRKDSLFNKNAYLSLPI